MHAFAKINGILHAEIVYVASLSPNSVLFFVYTYIRYH